MNDDGSSNCSAGRSEQSERALGDHVGWHEDVEGGASVLITYNVAKVSAVAISTG
jgi:hypothetical protein